VQNAKPTEQLFNFEVTADDKHIFLNAFEKIFGENVEEKFTKNSSLVVRSIDKVSSQMELGKTQRTRSLQNRLSRRTHCGLISQTEAGFIMLTLLLKAELWSCLTFIILHL